MHYYKRDIGKYHKKAGKLSMLEHGAYTLLLDACYDREVNPTEDEAIDWCWARTDEEIAAVKLVLRKFFIFDDGVYKQSTIEETLSKYHENAKTNKRIAKERERKRREEKERNYHEPCTVEHEPPPNYKLEITNHELKEKDIAVNTADHCPHEQVVELYHNTLPTLPRVRMWTDKRKRHLKARWREEPKRQNLEWWRNYFEYVGKSDFLMGRVEPLPGRKLFQADLEWLVNESNMVKVIEGKYE